jgi:hypothetical protein
MVNSAVRSRKSPVLPPTLVATTLQPSLTLPPCDLKQETPTFEAPNVALLVDGTSGDELDLQARLDNVIAMLTATNQHCQEVESQLKTAVAEAKVFREANISEADKSAAMALKLDKEVHDRKVVEAWQANVRKMIGVVEDLHWERARAPIRSDAEDIQGWLLKYEGAIEPLIRLTRI